MKKLVNKVIKWAEDRNIIEGSDPSRQIYKTMEEATELAVAIGAWSQEANQDEGDVEGPALEAKDAIGDITVTLIIIAEQLGFTFEDCLWTAWEEIKDRKGRIVNGVFVKELN